MSYYNFYNYEIIDMIYNNIWYMIYNNYMKNDYEI